MRTDLPQGTVSLLLTDIEGSTRLLHRLGAAVYADVLARHRKLLRDAFVAEGGVEVDTQGDAFFVAFPEAVGAVSAAAASQRALAAEAWPQDVALKVRMGIHTGTPQRTDEGYVGVDVHLAARIASSGHGGQILLSGRTADLLCGPTGADYSLRDLGEHRLKDIERPERLIQVVIPGLFSDFPPPRSLGTKPNNLPVPPTPFLGRTLLVTELRDLVLRPDVRLVTLTGPGGTGKSRLGLRVTTELLPRFGDGAFFVPLAAVHDAKLVASAIATALGVREEGKPLLDSLTDHLSGKETLLLIDNFEQVQSAARELATLLSRCPRLKMIVTSREALRLSGSRAFAVPPLDLPGAGRLPPLAELARIEAISLFVERASSVRADFVLDDTNAADVVAICRQVDALPLAIELAAARVRTMTPERLRRALEKRLKVLTTGSDDLLDHQRTLRDLIAWSYDLLSPEEQTLWRRLAIFAGGCTMDAAQAVCDLDDDIEVELDSESLVAKSLLVLDFGTERSGADKVIHGESFGPRLSMLETLREFALEKLSATADEAPLRARHRDWFVRLAETAEPHLRGALSERWMRTLDADYTNVRAALECALGDAAPGDSALRIGAALWYYWYQRGLLGEGRQWLERALAETAAGDLRHRARALLGASSLTRQLNLPEQAEQFCVDAVAAYRQLRDREGVAVALSQQGAIAERRGDFERAATLLAEALPVLRQVANKERLAFTLNALGVAEHVRGRLDAAAACYQESLAIGRELADKNAIATALVNLGEIAQLQGDVATATQRYRDSLRLYSELHLALAIAYCLEILAGIDAAAGRAGEAAVLFGAADRLREDLATPVESFNEKRYRHDVDLAQTALGAAAFTAAWQRGRELNVDQAVELAMRDEVGT